MSRYQSTLAWVLAELESHARAFPDTKSHHAAVLFYRHKPVAWGLNRPDRTRWEGQGGAHFSLHAEVETIRRSCPKHRERAAELLVVRRRRDGTLAESRCCEACMRFLAGATGVQRVVYTTDGGGLEVCRVPR